MTKYSLKLLTLKGWVTPKTKHVLDQFNSRTLLIINMGWIFHLFIPNSILQLFDFGHFSFSSIVTDENKHSVNILLLLLLTISKGGDKYCNILDIFSLMFCKVCTDQTPNQTIDLDTPSMFSSVSQIIVVNVQTGKIVPVM